MMMKITLKFSIDLDVYLDETHSFVFFFVLLILISLSRKEKLFSAISQNTGFSVASFLLSH